MFGQASIISPIANAFAIPIISLVVVPLAILGSLLHLDFILHAAHFALEICMQGLSWLATFPLWQQAAPPMWTLVVAIFGVLWMLLPRGFPQRWLGLVLTLPLFFVSSPKPAIGEMHVAVLDVGQGLAVTIQTANHTLLYDAGPRYSAQSDAGSKIVVPFLRGQGVKKLDGFIVSHNDNDHSGGAASVLAQVPVGWFASSFETAEISATQKRIKCFAGQHWQWDGVEFEVLYPSIENYGNADMKDNNMSCVVKVTSQFGSILLTGDIEKEAEKALLEHALRANIYAASGDAILNDHVLNNNVLKSDVLIAPHHGSKTSSTPEFIAAVAAKHIIFTVGYLNRFKHPKPMIVNRYTENGAVLYRSDYQGAVNVDFLSNHAIKIKAWRESEPRYWHEKYASKPL
jgi:competence protein ComEC